MDRLKWKTYSIYEEGQIHSFLNQFFIHFLCATEKLEENKKLQFTKFENHYIITLSHISFSSFNIIFFSLTIVLRKEINKLDSSAHTTGEENCKARAQQNNGQCNKEPVYFVKFNVIYTILHYIYLGKMYSQLSLTNFNLLTNSFNCWVYRVLRRYCCCCCFLGCSFFCFFLLRRRLIDTKWQNGNHKHEYECILVNGLPFEMSALS